MNRRGFLTAIAGVALATMAARTGFAQSTMPALVGIDPSMEGDFSTAALRFRDKEAWYIVMRDVDQTPQMFIVTDQEIEELPEEDAIRFRARTRVAASAEDWRAFYGSNS